MVQNLLISHIELRTEDSADVVPYTFKKNMETVVVPIGGKLTEIRDRYIQVYSGIFDKNFQILSIIQLRQFIGVGEIYKSAAEASRYSRQLQQSHKRKDFYDFKRVSRKKQIH